MDEIINEIKRAEEAAAALIAEAQNEASRIYVQSDADIAALSEEYEQKLKADSLVLAQSAKARINNLKAEAEANSHANINQLRSEANGKLSSCADFVYDYIIKECAK